MMRTLILVSLGVIVAANSIPSYIQSYPHSLEGLFGAKREVAGEKKKNERSLCESEDCKLISNMMKQGMNEAADPCDDFYEYACGNWGKNNPVPENRISWSMWSVVQKNIEKQVEALIQGDAKPTDLFAVRLSKKWYKSCMDTEAEERRGVEPILSTLWRHGGWPLIMEDGEWDERIYNWQIVDDQYARLLGLNSFHDVTYGSLTYDDDNNTIIIETPHLPLHISRLFSDDSFYPSSDVSDENNESGEGSQEPGSKERGKNNGNKGDEEEENDEDNETDEGFSEEETEGEDEEEGGEIRKKEVARRKLHKRLGHSRKNSNKNKVARKHISEGRTRKRTKRDVVRTKVLHRMLHKVRKQGKHGVHHGRKKTKGSLSKHSHLSVPNKIKTSTKRNNSKNDAKEETANNVIVQGRKDGQRKDKKNNEDEEELRKKKVARRKISKRLGHGRGENNKNKAAGKHVHERKTEEKSKRATVNTKLHNNKHRAQKKISNHRKHHVARISDDAENGDENEKEDNSADNDNNEVEDEENGDDSNDKGEDDEGNDTGSVDEESDEGDDDEEDSDNKDDEDEDKDDDEEDDGEKDEDGDDEDEDSVEKLKEEYRNYILNAALILSEGRGIEVPREKLEKDVANLLEFAIKLGELTLEYDDDPVTTTLDSFQESYNALIFNTKNSKINWKRKILKLFAEAGVDIEDDVEIVVSCPTYIKKLHSLLDETPSETIVNYIHWLFINKMTLFTAPELRKLAESWYGRPYYDSRAEQCIEQVEMSDIIGYEYVRKHFSEEIAKTARDMIDDIQKEVEYQIKESTWMDGDTKHFILDKLVAMKNMIGYPDWYRNTTILKHHFQGLTVGPSYYENILGYVRYLKWKNLRQIMEDDELAVDYMDPLMLNAFFMPTENSIAITAADFQSPMFALNRPWNVNYGIIGVVMGHEVNHGFDDSGHLYDREGKPMEWLSAMAAAYDQRADCFVHQFNNYSLLKEENYTVENYGNQTAGENIADTMGLQAVYRAYQRRQRQCKKPDPALPGLEEFSNDQIFFLSFANLWCETEDRESVIDIAKYDVHSTGRLRVIGSVSNSEDFAKAFNCPVGSPMNPENKCNIWI